MDRVERRAVRPDPGQRGAGRVGQLLPQHERVRVRLHDAGPVPDQQRAHRGRVRVGDQHERAAEVQQHAEQMVEARVHERHVQGRGLAPGGPAHRLLRHEPVPHRLRAVHGQLGHARGARAVGDQGGFAGVEPDGRGWLGAGVPRQGFRPGRVVHGQRPPHEPGQVDAPQSVQRRAVGDQPGPAQPCEELPGHGGGQRRRQQHRHGPDPGERAGQQHDVDVVRLVHDDLLRGPHPRLPQPPRQLLDQLGQDRVGQVDPEGGGDVQRPVEGDEDGPVPVGGAPEDRSQIETAVGEQGLSHGSFLSERFTRRPGGPAGDGASRSPCRAATGRS